MLNISVVKASLFDRKNSFLTIMLRVKNPELSCENSEKVNVDAKTAISSLSFTSYSIAPCG